MADEAQRSDPADEPVNETPRKEDAQTSATRRELKQTSISEKGEQPRPESRDSSNGSEADEADEGETKEAAPSGTKTPDQKMDDAPVADKKEGVSSPKKKRAHDQLDEPKDAEDILPPSADVNGSRTDRSEPEKKRVRDKHSGDEGSRPTSSGTGATKPSDKKDDTVDKKEDEKPKQTSSTAFANSGFAKLATQSASPFGAVGSTGTNIFGGGSSSASPFGGFGGALAAKPAEAPKLSFGGASSSMGGASPFGGLSGGQSSGFGSALGGGGSAFSSLLSGGPKLANFAKPGETFKSDKKARAFGAPESDEEGDDNDDDDDEGSGDEAAGSDDKDDDKAGKNEKSEEPKEPSDQKKSKLQKVVVESGEAGEVSLLQVRAKMYQMEKGDGWKERGAGILKVNVPVSTVDFDNADQPIPSSFDASVLEDEPTDGSNGRKSVRLIMRQDHTLRVILNTVISPHMDFKLTTKLKSSFVLFMAFEGTEVKQVQMKMSEVNAKNFIETLKIIQRSLQDV